MINKCIHTGGIQHNLNDGQSMASYGDDGTKLHCNVGGVSA